MTILPEYKNFKELFCADGFDISEEQYARLHEYARTLVEWNEKMNLTGITDPDGITIKHFLDSILPLKFLKLSEGSKVIDVGTGAGFPGLPLKIYRPDIKLTLLDSLNKRVNFLSEACNAANIDAECVHARAEECGHDHRFREKFDAALARAVAAMPVLAEYCMPFVKIGGIFAAMKGPNENYSDGENAVKILGGEIADVKEYELPNGDKRVLIIVKKLSATSEKYPRNGGQISKKPL
ncbi:MAG: 16S rRNA (guanine(527)-N(7))-methyltransferase RsmG [Oscillospiraceae bacterium]|nr:16S rRNA (guanine(527)-N(7))-methyltransferase RsmG [Oscillospiraceae bacterium]